MLSNSYNTEHAKWDQEKRELMIRIKELEQEKAVFPFFNGFMK